MKPNPVQLRSAVALLLCGSFFAGPLPQAFCASQPQSRPLNKEGRADLLLSRFTFGPTAAERQTAARIGPEAWFERQLNPAAIPDDLLERRLDAYPALRMADQDRLARYPEPATLRQIAKRGVLPDDPEERAIVGSQVEFYEMAQRAKTGGAAGNTTATGANTPASPLEAGIPAMPRDQVLAILALSPADRYGRILSMRPEEMIALRKATRGAQEGSVSEGMTPLQRETLLALSGTNRMINAETQGARLLRDLYSQRQLEAVMTDFWLNHFNVFSGKSGQEPSLIPGFERTVRAHALGRFEDLLVATAESPAMLIYLDNSTSEGPDSVAATRQRRNPKNKGEGGLNENYARELMELHTLGVNGGYTQRDVTEVARVFTGWTLERPNDGGAFVFNPNRHEPGSKTVLGRTIAESGEAEGHVVLHMLATSPATAHFLSTELAQRFVSDTPPPAMIARMEKTFLKTGGDLREVLRTMVHSPEFFSSTTVNAKLKTPLEYVTSAVRASGAEVSNPLPLVQALQQLGMPLYGCQPPTGYKWDEETWLSSSALINRMNFALSLSTNRIGGVITDWSPALTGSALFPESGSALFKTASVGASPFSAEDTRKEALLEASLFPVPVSERTRTAVLSQGNDSTAQEAAQQFAAGGNGRPLTDAEKEAQQQDRLDAMMSGRRDATMTAKGKGLNGAAGPQRGLGAIPAKLGPPPADRQAAAMAGLLLGSPEFQRR